MNKKNNIMGFGNGIFYFNLIIFISAIEAAVSDVLQAGPRTRDIGGDAPTETVRDAVLAALAAHLQAAAHRSHAERQPATS